MQRIILSLFILFTCQSWAHAIRFDWNTVLDVPPGNEITGGHQILHFKCFDKPYQNSEEACLFVEKYLKDAVPLSSDAEVIKFGSDSVTISGLFIELGVCTGKTINFIAALNPHQKVYGFDSFEGLPEDWVKGEKTIKRGTFAFKNPNMFPPVLHNVELIKGLFSDSLGAFIQSTREPIAFLFIDSDIYSSAASAFEILGDRIRPGTILVFDELYNYPGFENHEFKALQELLSKHNLGAHYLAYNTNHEQVAIQITER